MRYRNGTVRISIMLVAVFVLTSSVPIAFSDKTEAYSDPGPMLRGFIPAENGLPAAANQHSVWLGDINNDSKLDLATAGYEGVLVWASDGLGNWSPNSTGLPNAYDGGICMGDIDNDGNLDIAAANYNFNPGGIGVWRGNGMGSWTPAMTGLPSNRFWTGIHLMDMNHDNNLDIAVGHEGLGPRVYAGNGAGSWDSASINLPTSGKYEAVWMGDVNHDNNVDLAAAGDGLHVYLGNGAGVWTEASNGLPSLTDTWNSVTLGDFNLDGHLDIVSAMDGGGNGLRAWLGDGSSNWTQASNGLPTSGLFYGVVLTDFVGDKYPDLLAAQYSGGGVRLYEGNGGISWNDVTASVSLPTTGDVIGVAAGDINNDGYMGIAAVGEGFGVHVWVSDIVTPPLSVTVKQPDGGESWEIGTQHYINWTVSGGTPPFTINLEYSTTGVMGSYTTIQTGLPNTGSYLWDVPLIPTTNAFVRVNTTDSLGVRNWDKSNNSFTIFSPDTTPPTISNLQPANNTWISDATPLIGANYSDASGIDVGSVVLRVDFVDVTSSSVVTASGVTYIPVVPLLNGLHDVDLSVSDSHVLPNTASESWRFTIDTIPPSVTNLLPVNQSTITTNTPLISADYSDATGIDTTTVVLKIDLVDVTSSATVTPSSVSITPALPLSDGRHDIYLEVNDTLVPANRATMTWWFIVNTTSPDTTPPTVSALQPINHSTTSNQRPIIGADYADSSGIDTGSVILKVDSIDVTSLSTLTPTGVRYTPSSSLSEGIHDVYLEVEDASTNRNKAVATWQFTVDSLPPSITNLQPTNQSYIGDSTPTVSASYSDISGINVAGVTLRLDSIDVTASSSITPAGISYTPVSPLTDGTHTVYLSVPHLSVPANDAMAIWSFTVDTQPPTIVNNRPANSLVISDNMPIIGAQYTDSTGIDTSSVILTVDSVNVTSSATITPTEISYQPPSTLAEGPHAVSLIVCDSSLGRNEASISWGFTIDTQSPTISDLAPANRTTIGTNRPNIAANYSDGTGITTAMTVLKIDGVNVTSIASVTSQSVTLVLAASLAEGDHTITLTVADTASPPNVAYVEWFFTIDTTAPSVVHQPVTEGIVGSEISIEARVTDASGLSNIYLYYRTAGGGQFSRVSMTRIPATDMYTAVIPASVVTTAGVEYYIEANDTVDNLGGSPITNRVTQPYKVTITEVQQQSNWVVFLVVGMAIVTSAILAVLILIRMRPPKQDVLEEEPDEDEKGPEDRE